MPEIKEYQLGKIAGLRYGKMISRNDMTASGYPVYSGYRITGFANKYMLEEPAVIVVARGVGGTGDVKISPAKAWITNLSIIIDVDEKIADKKYLQLYLQRDNLKRKLDTGAAQSQITINSLSVYHVNLPSLEYQKRVALIIQRYDDLIENNSKRIEKLEAIANLIYRNYHERHKKEMVSSTIGDCLLELESGKRPKGGVGSLAAGIPSIGAENINGVGHHDFSKDKFVSVEFFDSMNKGKIKDGDVAIYKDGAYIGRSSYFLNNFPHAIACINEHVFLLRPNKEVIGSGQLYLIIQSPEVLSAIRGTNSNSAQPGINQAGLKGVHIKLLPKDSGIEFENVIHPLFMLIATLAKKNHNLSRARDMLLPRLMSGEIKV